MFPFLIFHVTRLDRVVCYGCWHPIYCGQDVVIEEKTGWTYHPNCARYFDIKGDNHVLH